MLSVLPQLRRAIRRNQLVYTFGPDMAFMALLASIGLKRRPLILEVGDLRKIQVSSGIKGTLMRNRQMDREIVRLASGHCSRLC